MILIKGSLLLLFILFGAVSSQESVSFPDPICPDWPQGVREVITWANRTCIRDSDCNDPKLCCFDGEDKHCTDPAPSRLGPSECRNASLDEDDCRAKGMNIYGTCSTDDDCLRTETCCSDETCFWDCLSRRVERPGAPPVIIGETNVRNNYWTGRDITMLCSGKGEGLQTVTWYKTKEYPWYLKPLRDANVVTKITHDGRRIESELRIPNSGCDDRAWGEYKCSIKTELGRSSMKAFTISIFNRKTALNCEGPSGGFKGFKGLKGAGEDF